MLLVLLDFVLGVFIFYYYTYPLQREEFEADVVKLDKELLNNVVSRMEESQHRFEEAESKDYPNSFAPITLEQEEPSLEEGEPENTEQKETE